MRTIYSLKEFYNQAKQLAETKGIDYAMVRVEFDKHKGLRFFCYAHGYNWYGASTMQESIELLRAALYPIFPEERKDDVEIEMNIPQQ